MLRVWDDSIQTTFYSIDEDRFRQIYGLLMSPKARRTSQVEQF